MNQKELKKLSLLAEAACYYYEYGLTQDEIAQRLCLSRTRVSRLLKEAHEKGIVSFNINYHYERHYLLEDQLKERFGLKDVCVLNNRNCLDKLNATEIRNSVAKLAAVYVMDHLRKDMIIGTSWGVTLAETIHHLPAGPQPVQLVQLIGSIPCRHPEHTPQGAISNMAALFQCPGYFLNLPLFIENDYVRSVMMDDANNKRILNMGMFCDMVLTGISDIRTIHARDYWLGYMSEEMYHELLEKGAVGAICARFYDSCGNEIDCNWNRHCVGISFSRLKDVPNVVVIASGTNKAQAITYALKNNLMDTLITDGSTAAAILGIQHHVVTEF